MEQGAAALAHFAAHVLLARWLAPAAYGAFALAWALFLVAEAVQHALVIEPLLVFARRGEPRARAAHSTAALRMGALGCLAAAAALAAAAGLAALGGHGEVARALLSFACAAPALLGALLLRRWCHARLVPQAAARAALWYLLATLAGLFAARAAGLLSVPVAVGVLAVSAALAGTCVLLRLGLPERVADAGPLPRAWAAHWSYGRFALLAALSRWAPWNLHFLLLAGPLGLEGVAALRALQNAIVPLRQVTASLALTSIPWTAEQLDGGRGSKARSALARLGVAQAAAGALYVATLAAVGPAALAWLYGNAYDGVTALAAWAAAAQLPVGAIAVAGVGLRAAGRSDRALVGNAVYAGLSLALGGAGAVLAGPPGLVAGMGLAACAALAAALRELRASSPFVEGVAGSPSAEARRAD